MNDEVLDLTVSFESGDVVNIAISGYSEPGQVISALRKLGRTDYLLSLHDAMRGIDHDDYEEDWDE